MLIFPSSALTEPIPWRSQLVLNLIKSEVEEKATIELGFNTEHEFLWVGDYGFSDLWIIGEELPGCIDFQLWGCIDLRMSG